MTSSKIEKTALDVFLQAATRTPDKVVLYYFDGAIEYGELDRMSDALAAALIDGGFSAGDRVGIYLQNMPHFQIANLAAWKAGGIAVPINPMNRQRELTLLLNDFTPKALVLTPELYKNVYSRLPEDAFRPPMLFGASPLDFQTRNDPRIFPSTGVGLQQAEGLPDMLDTIQRNEGRKARAVAPSHEDIAYLVYTSGTTGVPKGVQLLHRNVVAGLAINQAASNATDASRIAGMAPLFHVTGLMSVVNLPFAVSALSILSYRFDPAVMIDSVREHRATHIAGAATAFIAMMNVPGATSKDMESIRSVGSGGAPTPAAIVEQIEGFMGAPVQNGYGLTETAVASHITPVGTKIPVDSASGALSVGPNTPGITSWLEGEDGRRLGPGEAGEIVTSGPTVAAGYWKKPVETAEVFRPDGFRTGDIAVCDENGWFYLVDRKKDMISASGYKVWPREVEDVLYAHPAVREAAVVGIPDAYRGESVRAVVSLRLGASATIEELSQHCRTQLAAYKAPREIRIIDELPKTISGKILRRMLRD